MLTAFSLPPLSLCALFSRVLLSLPPHQPPPPPTPQKPTPTQAPFTNDGSVNTVQQRLGALDISSLPHSYKSNSTKEELALEYAENFRRQFISLFPDRKPLILFPKNECGVRKLVCTTIRPTQLQYRQLYNLQACSRFVSSFLDFEPVEEATRIPSVLPSPSFVMKQQVGDSFGFANVLCSLLVGAGYDAYVVCGYAPQWITMHDETWQEPPTYAFEGREGDAPESGDKNNNNNGGGGGGGKSHGGKTNGGGTTTEQEEGKRSHRSPRGSGYEVHSHGIPESTFLKNIARKAKAQVEIAKQKKQEEGDPDPNEGVSIPDESTSDPLYGQRFHAWVMVSPHKREVGGYYFIEATNGRIYPVENNPYYGIESLWNHRNYWVNMQGINASDDPRGCADAGCGEFNYDLTNTEHWEYVFIDPLLRGPGGSNDETKDDGSTASGNVSPSGSPSGSPRDGTEGGGGATADDFGEEQVLDLPPSWVSKLSVARERYRLTYSTTGSNTTLYKRCKVELYANNVHEMGLVMRTTTYRDLGRTIPLEILELFQNRRDKLFRRIRVPLQCLIKESFAPGRSSGIKDLIAVLGRKRVMKFYLSARLDGLLQREENVGAGMVEVFEGRDDCLNRRDVVVDRNAMASRGQNRPYTLPSGELGDLVITSMTECFDRNEEVQASINVARRMFSISDGRASYAFHYDRSQITASKASYYKDESKTNDYSSKYESSTDPAAHNDEIAEVWAAEKECYAEVRNSERETSEILSARVQEEGRVILDRSVFDTAHQRAQEAGTWKGGEEGWGYWVLGMHRVQWTDVLSLFSVLCCCFIFSVLFYFLFVLHCASNASVLLCSLFLCLFSRRTQGRQGRGRHRGGPVASGVLDTLSSRFEPTLQPQPRPSLQSTDELFGGVEGTVVGTCRHHSKTVGRRKSKIGQETSRLSTQPRPCGRGGRRI